MPLSARLAGASLLAIALSISASHAQVAQAQTAQPDSGVIDEIIDDAPPAPPPAATGDPLQDKLSQLEARIQALEARNAELEEKAAFAEGRIEKVETRAAKGVQPNVAPTFADTSGQFSFKLRGVINADVAIFNERKGGYDYNSGTGFRRARLGVEGVAFRDFAYRLEADFSGNAVTVTDAYLQYTAIKPFTFTVGQHKAPYGLEANNSDNFNVFLERGQFTNAFGTAGAERRIGASTAYQSDTINVAVGIFGDSDAISRSNLAPATPTSTPDESWGFNGRATWNPVLDTGRVVQLGVSSYWRTSLKAGDTENAVRLTERPNIRVDNSNIADSGVITGTDSLTYLGAEAALVQGPLTVVGEYGRLRLNRPDLADVTFDGYYAFATWFLTGESRAFRNGNFDRVRPLRDLKAGSGWGAVELALRYDRLDLSNTPVLARAGGDSNSWTLAMNWYLNANAKVMVNWVRFAGDNTPLDPLGNETAGDTFAARVHLDW